MPTPKPSRGRVVRYSLPNGHVRVAIINFLYWGDRDLAELIVFTTAFDEISGAYPVLRVSNIDRADQPERGKWHWPDTSEGAADVLFVVEPEPKASAEVALPTEGAGEVPADTALGKLTESQQAALTAEGQAIIDAAKQPAAEDAEPPAAVAASNSGASNSSS